MAGNFEQAKSWIDRFTRHPQLWQRLATMIFLAFVILALYTWQIHRDQRMMTVQLGFIQAELTNLQAQHEALQNLSENVHQQLLERETQVALFANATRVIALEGTEDAPQARGTFYMGDNASVLVLQGLPPLPKSEIYELWLIPSSGEPMAVGTVPVNRESATTTQFELADEMQEFAAVGVSIEPAGGSLQPTGPIVLLGTVNVAGGR